MDARNAVHIIVARGTSGNRPLPMPEYRKTRVYAWDTGDVFYFPDNKCAIDDTHPEYIEVFVEREYAEQMQIPARLIVSD